MRFKVARWSGEKVVIFIFGIVQFAWKFENFKINNFTSDKDNSNYARLTDDEQSRTTASQDMGRFDKKEMKNKGGAETSSETHIIFTPSGFSLDGHR